MDDGSFSVNLSAGQYELNGLDGERSGSISLPVLDGGSSEVTLRLAPD